MEDKKENKYSVFFSKAFSVIFVIVAGYFFIQWIVGDISQKPLAELTLKDISSAVLGFFVALLILKVIKGLLEDKD